MHMESDEIVIESAVKLSSDQLDKIKLDVQEKLKVDLPVVNKLNTKLIGGFTIRVNDWFLDSSLVRQIEFIKRTLLE